MKYIILIMLLGCAGCEEIFLTEYAGECRNKCDGSINVKNFSYKHSDKTKEIICECIKN